ncbi:hypothetical protein P7C70_g8317, partial [Phenoliferia sp. Uapishka_3]
MISSPSSTSTSAPTTSRPQDSIITRSHVIILRFLESQGYIDTLSAFKREASSALSDVDLLSETDASTDLREVVEDYLAKRFNALEIPTAPLEEELQKLRCTGVVPNKVVKVIRDGTNVLSVRKGVLPRRSWDSQVGRFKSEFVPAIFTTAVDRTLKLYSSETFELLDTHQFQSPILSIAVHPTHPRMIVAGTMEGSLQLLDLVTREVVSKVKDHTKYIVRTAWSDDGNWIASIGYDHLIQIYLVHSTPSTSPPEALLDDEIPDELSSSPTFSIELRHTHTCKSNPEALVFLPGSGHLVFTARDDNIMHYMRMPSPDGTVDTKTDFEVKGYNLNENGDAWVSFSVLYITLHPTLPLLSLQTSTENSRILLYPFHSSQRLLTLFTTAGPSLFSSFFLPSFSKQRNTSLTEPSLYSLAEQSEFTTPRHRWLPDGSSVLVNSEDGILRVVDLKGKVQARIGAHGIAGQMEVGGEEGERARARREADRGSSVVKDVEVLEIGEGEEKRMVFVSCGFDKTVRVVDGRVEGAASDRVVKEILCRSWADILLRNRNRINNGRLKPPVIRSDLSVLATALSTPYPFSLLNLHIFSWCIDGFEAGPLSAGAHPLRTSCTRGAHYAPHLEVTRRIKVVDPENLETNRSNLHRLEEELLRVSDPRSAHYGKHWTSKQVADFFRPSETTLMAVEEWLVDAGLGEERIKSSRGGHWMKVVVSVAEAEDLLETSYESFEHEAGFQRIGEPLSVTVTRFVR